MEITKLKPTDVSELTLVKLSSEIAKNIQPLENILETFGIEPEVFSEISKLPRFATLLQSQTEAWNSANNTRERVELKALSFVEEGLPELYERLHDPREPLAAKVKAFEIVGRFAGIGAKAEGAGNGGEGMRVTINIGGDQITFEKDITPQVIEAEPEDE